MITFHYASGSPYAWRVWFALEHKQLPYEQKLLSFSAGDLAKPEFAALNPRRKVPVIVDDGFSLYESGAILEYLEDRYPHAGRPLLPTDIKKRAIARRIIREADAYLAAAMEALADQILFTPREQWDEGVIQSRKKEFLAELVHWERYFSTEGTSTRPVDAVDLTLYPIFALAFRFDLKKPDLMLRTLVGPKLSEWLARVEALPYFAKTVPPHWKSG